MGHLRVGPQYRPPNPHGAQVIQRGPHGARLASDPVLDREGRPSGSGFQFWIEDQSPFLDKDLIYLPPQYVVGVYGMDGLGACPPGQPRFPGVAARQGPNPEADLLAELKRGVSAACNGRIPAANAAIKGARYFLSQVTDPARRAVWVNHIGATEGYIKRASVSVDTGARRRQAEAAEARRAAAIREYNQSKAEAQRQRDRLEISEAQFAQLLKDARNKALSAGAAVGAAAADVAAAPGRWLEDNWWKLALGAGGVMFFYGAGSGLFGR